MKPNPTSLDYILSQAIQHNACDTQLNPFRSALESGNIELAWSIAIGNATWLASRGITNIVELCKVSPTLVGISYYDNGSASEDKLDSTLASRRGNIAYKKTYNENGVLHGEYTEYYENGKIKYKLTYNEGLLHGEYTEYYENGKIAYKKTYNNGVRHGEYTYYYENGNIASKTTYNNDVELNPEL